MKNLKNIFLKIVLAVGMLLASGGLKTYAQTGEFPFSRSFLDGDMSGIKLPTGSKGQANAAGLVTQGLRLTNSTNQVGAFFLPDHRFSTEDGFMIEFEYIMKGSNNLPTDGIIMFLVDGQDKYVSGDNLKFGSPGAGFGYTHRFAEKDADKLVGIKGAYIAVGLDQSNFKVVREEGNELRNGINYTASGTGSTSSQLSLYDKKSNVTIRGAAGNGDMPIKFTAYGQTFNKTLKEGEWGYPVLITRYTGESNDPYGILNKAGFRLIPSTGHFEQHNVPAIPAPFNIAGEADFQGDESNAYRKMIIQLKPNPNTSEGGYIISVWIQHGQTKTQVIKDFAYPSTLKYLENGVAVFASSTPQRPSASPEVQYTVPRPSTLAIGFAASTGTDNPYTNIIRNLTITPAFAALTANDDITDHRRGPATILPLENDIGYSGTGNSMVEGSEYLDPSTFRFWINEDDHLGSQHTYIDPGKGRWIYDPATSEVIFFPDKGYKGTVSIMYDVLGRSAPYNQEKYRSKRATISIEIDDNQPAG